MHDPINTSLFPSPSVLGAGLREQRFLLQEDDLVGVEDTITQVGVARLIARFFREICGGFGYSQLFQQPCVAIATGGDVKLGCPRSATAAVLRPSDRKGELRSWDSNRCRSVISREKREIGTAAETEGSREGKSRIDRRKVENRRDSK